MKRLSLPPEENLPTSRTRSTDQIRRYVLVDVENLAFGGEVFAEEFAKDWRRIAKHLGLTSADHIVMGASRFTARHFRKTVVAHNIKWIVGSELPDGADRALLAAINLHHVAREYDELVIASGDHAFADLARQARKRGLTVRVVGVKRNRVSSSVAGELVRAASCFTRVNVTPEASRKARRGKQRNTSHKTQSQQAA